MRILLSQLMGAPNSIINRIIDSGSSFQDYSEFTTEGLGSALLGKVRDLAGAIFLRPRLVLLMVNPISQDTVAYKLKRGAVLHMLYRSENNGPDKLIKASRSVARLMIRLAGLAARRTAQGFIEI